jgi:hypothetical protein
LVARSERIEGPDETSGTSKSAAHLTGMQGLLKWNARTS